jgi:hypothetical protein
MFGSQLLRLLREKWNSPKELAEELYAMLQDGNPVETAGGLTLSNIPGVAPLTLKPSDFGTQPAISFGTAADDPAIGWQADDAGIAFDGPAFQFNVMDDGIPSTYDVGGNTKAPNNIVNKITVKLTAGGYPGKVMSGTGDTYQVQIYPTGLSGPSQTVSVKQLSIAEAAEIKAGTWTFVTKTTLDKKDFFYMQVPVWGDDPS